MSVFDPKVRFYLEHRARIDEWAALEDPARVACNAWLGGFDGRARALAAQLDSALVISHTEEGVAWPRVLLHRPAWRAGATSPEVAIALEWERVRVALDAPKQAPYVGVRVRFDHAPHGPKLSADLKARFTRHGLLAGGRTSTVWYPLFARMVAPPKFWDDPEPYAAAILDALRKTWQECAPLIDLQLAETPLPALASPPTQ